MVQMSVSDYETLALQNLENLRIFQASETFGRGAYSPTAQGYHAAVFTVQQHFVLSSRLFHRILERCP